MSRPDMSNPRHRIVLARCLIAGWLLTLLLPALTFGHGDPTSGLFQLLFGWFGTMAFQFGWYANLVLPFVLIMMTSYFPAVRPLKIASILLGLFALSTLDLFLRPDYHGVVTAHAGYFLWMGVCLIGALAGFLSARSLTPVAAPDVPSKAISP